MKKAENIRQEIFDKINAMSDDELARYIWKSRMRNSGVKWLTVISIVLWFVAILQNATYSITIFWLLALLCIVCTIAFIILIDKLGHFESRIVGVIAITTALCFTIGGEQFLLRLPYFKWLSSLIALFLLTDLVAIYRKGSARIEKCEENAAKTAFFCRKQQQPFTIEQIPDPVSWKYDVAAAIIQFCMCFILFFKVVLQLYQYDYCWSSNMLEEEYFNYVRNISILLLTTVGIIEAINYLISRSFSWRDFFIRKLWIFLFIGAMYVLPSVLYTAIVDHGYQWPADKYSRKIKRIEN